MGANEASEFNYESVSESIVKVCGESGCEATVVICYSIVILLSVLLWLWYKYGNDTSMLQCDPVALESNTTAFARIMKRFFISYAAAVASMLCYRNAII